jgi:hypothetical protein
LDRANSTIGVTVSALDAGSNLGPDFTDGSQGVLTFLAAVGAWWNLVGKLEKQPTEN